MKNCLGYVTETRVRLTKVRTAHSVYLLYVESKLTAQDHRSIHVKHRVNHRSLLLQSLTSHAQRFWDFFFSTLPLLPACRSHFTPLYSKSTLRGGNAITHPPHTRKKKSSHHSLSLAHIMMERRQQSRERHYSGELVSSRLSGFL